jgi:hypothetical protein
MCKNVCNKTEDIQHLLIECVKNKDERTLFIKEINLNALDVGFIQGILSDPKSEMAKKICSLVSVYSPLAKLSHPLG